MASNYPAKRAYKSHGSLTPEKAELFFTAIAGGISLAGAARAAGVTHATIYERRKIDPEFAKAIETAREAGADRMEDELLKHGVQYKSDTALIFLLKGRRPHIYRENVAIGGFDGGPVQYERVERVIVDPASIVATQYPKKVAGAGNGESKDGAEPDA